MMESESNKDKPVQAGFVGYYRQIFAQLPTLRKKQFWLLALIMVILAITEAVAVGLISFYAAAISDPASVLKINFINVIETALGTSFAFTKKSLIGWLSVVVIVAVVLKNGLRGIFVHSVSRYSAHLEAYFGRKILERFLFSPYEWYLQQNSADLIQIINWRIYVGRNFVTPLLNILSESCVLLALLVSLLLIEPLVFLLFVVVQGGGAFIFYRRLKKNLDSNAAKCKEKDRNINREITRAIHGFKDVKITATQEYFIDRFDAEAVPYAKDFGWQQFWREAPLLTLESVGFLLVCGAILFMLYGLNYSPLAITGTTALLAVTAWRTLPALNRVVAALTNIRTALPYVKALLPFMKETPAYGKHSETAPSTGMEFNQGIEFKDVTFSYNGTPQRKIMDRFNLIIKKGQTVGIMGPSGCGKSTLVDLLVGLLLPQEGQILIDGQVLGANSIKEWTSGVGYVPQHPYIFDGTVIENVAFGIALDKVDQSKVAACCANAAIDFLADLPLGMHTVIGERGVRLSGGQCQRIAIARTLYRSPTILIFDEATSSLDDKNDARIKQLIETLGGTHTLIVVSHRKSSLEGCDFIYNL